MGHDQVCRHSSGVGAAASASGGCDKGWVAGAQGPCGCALDYVWRCSQVFLEETALAESQSDYSLGMFAIPAFDELHRWG